MSFIGKSAVFAAIFACFATGYGAEKAQETTGGSGSLLSRIRKNCKVEPIPDRLENSFLLVRSPDGRGSAFLTRLWNQPVIVTNAHVYLAMKDPEVVDVNGRIYRIKEVIGSKSRDLVILAYEGPGPKTGILNVIEDAAAVPLSSKVAAYGNSLGDDVIVTEKGKLIAVGPDKIEVDAPFVRGNSGGPVLLDKGHKVIGVATYMRSIRPDWTNTGSKYKSTHVKLIVRRFATRIDNLSPGDLEPLKLEDLSRERELAAQSDDWVEDIRKTLGGWLSLGRIQSFREECVKRAPLLTEGESIKWHSSYLKREYRENRDMIVEVLKMLDLDSVLESSQIGAILEQNTDRLNPTLRCGVPVRCFLCHGSGRLSTKRLNPRFDRHSVEPQYLIEEKTCPVCNGNRELLLWPERLCFDVPDDVAEKVGKGIPVCNEKFCGFQLGGKEADELNRFPFYCGQPLYVIPESFGETRVYRGNHEDASAACTKLTFLFGRLMKVAILTPRSSSGVREVVNRFRRREIPDSTPMSISASRIADCRDIPMDRYGHPLLKPEKSAVSSPDVLWGNRRMESARQTASRYEGMWIVGAHRSLAAIDKIDLPTLAQHCRDSKSKTTANIK